MAHMEDNAHLIKTVTHNLISVQFHCSTRSSDVIILFRPPFSSSLKVNNRSFRHASPCLWNQLPKELCLPIDHEDLSLSSDLTHISFITTVTIHYSFSLPLQVQNSSFPQIFPRSSSAFPPTGLTHTSRTPAVFRFSRACRF